MNYNFQIIDLTIEVHQKALFKLMNAYMLDKMGCGKELSAKLFETLLIGLQKQANYVGILVKDGNKFIGLANCFCNFSTFSAAPLLNVHDFIILQEYRRKGAGKYLMQSVKEVASERSCVKVNLEVREDNFAAQKLYQLEGFRECDPNMYFWEVLL